MYTVKPACLEDHPSGCKWLISHCDWFRPLSGVVGPLPNRLCLACKWWLLQLLGTNICPPKVCLKMIVLYPFGGILHRSLEGNFSSDTWDDPRSLPRWKVNSKILCMSWTNDGLHVALGLFNGLDLRGWKGGGEDFTGERRGCIMMVDV